MSAFAQLPHLPVAPVLQPIPPRLVQAWVGGPVPSWVQASFDRWDAFLDESAHEWDVERVTDATISDGPYARLRTVAEQHNLPPRGLADLIRVMAVSYRGGFWMDVDVVPLRSLDDLVRSDVSGWTTSQPESQTQGVMWNGGFGFGGAHPFLADVFDHARTGLRRGARNEHFLAGPRAYRRALERNHDVRTEWDFSVEATTAERRAMFYGAELDTDNLRGRHPGRVTHVGPRP